MNYTKQLDLLTKMNIVQAVSYIIKLNKRFFFSFVKRLFDIVISLSVIVLLLSWLLPILAILIKLDSKGPVFFLQKRVGAFGKTFYCIKLRSMIANPLANIQQAGENDPRITPVGRFLRYSCLDEFPQFINVFLGDMSIVGPRPHMIYDCLDFSKVVPNYELRHMVKPGITGLAQVKGYKGKVNSLFDITHRYRFDMFYIKKACFLLDLRIIFGTFLQVLSSVSNFSQRRYERMEEQIPDTAITPAPLIPKIIENWYEVVPHERQSA